MKKILLLLLFVGGYVGVTFGNSTTPCVTAIFDGFENGPYTAGDYSGSCFPSMQQMGAHYVVGVRANNASWGVGAAVDGLCPGGSQGTWYDFGSTYTQNQAWGLANGQTSGGTGSIGYSQTFSAAVLNCAYGSQLMMRIGAYTGPVPDGNGSPNWVIHFTLFYSQPTNGVLQNTNTGGMVMPTNGLPVVVTNADLTTVPPSTNAVASTNVTAATNQIIWTGPGGGNLTENTYIQGANGLDGAIWSLRNQMHSDLNGIANLITSGNSQEHSDLRGINQILANGTAQAHSDAGGIASDILLVNGSVNNLTNYLGRMSTNQGFTLTNYAQQNTLAGVSNILAGLSDTNYGDIASEKTLESISNLLAMGTNHVGTNVSTSTNVSLSLFGVLTNAASASAAAASAEGDYGVDGLVTSLTPSLPSDSPSAPSLMMNFCGYALDLDPVHQFPSVATASRVGFGLVALLAFLLEVGTIFWKLLQLKASTSTGGVPDLELSALGTGGNVLGILAAVVVPVAFITIFTASMAFLFNNLGITIGDAMNISGWTNSLGGIGYYLLASFIPVRLLFSLLCTRITLQFTFGKIVDLALSASRFLIGK